ncbi:MAG: LemA family protein [Candidatus Coproplasma sp.]
MNNLLISGGALAGIIASAVVVLLIIIIVCWAIGVRNGFVKMRNNYEEAFSSIDVQLKKRYDLIPNLVETVKGYAKHESQTLENVISARNKAVGAGTNADKIQADADLSRAIKSIYAVAENYPDLKASQNFASLSNQLSAIENQLADYRRYYNAKIKAFNTARELFPKSIIANMMHLEKQPYFELDSSEERKNVEVKF